MTCNSMDLKKIKVTTDLSLITDYRDLSSSFPKTFPIEGYFFHLLLSGQTNVISFRMKIRISWKCRELLLR